MYNIMNNKKRREIQYTNTKLEKIHKDKRNLDKTENKRENSSPDPLYNNENYQLCFS